MKSVRKDNVDIYYNPDGTIDGWGMIIEGGLEVPEHAITSTIEKFATDITKTD